MGEHYREWWKEFRKRSRVRTDNFRGRKIPPMRTVFDLDAEEEDLVYPE